MLLLLDSIALKVPELVDQTPEALLQDMAGNAMAFPVLLALVSATLVAVSWRRTRAEQRPPTTASEMTAALAVLQRLGL